jgi:hypothetical protein
MKKRDDLIYPDLCYKIVGILYDVFNEIGPGHKEVLYQKAISIALDKNKVQFSEQVYTPLKYQNEQIGKYFLDFLSDSPRTHVRGFIPIQASLVQNLLYLEAECIS